MAPSPVDELALLDLERSNKGASKQRRDQINAEIAVMRDLLPLPESARQRLSQLQIMSLSCVFIRKCNVLQKLFQTHIDSDDVPCEFSQSLTGFLLVTTRDGKLVYISENVTEYLGHSMVDMKTQGDSLFDIVDKRDHGTVQAQLLHGGAELDQDQPTSFFCRMNMSRTLKRQAGFGDVKVMHVRGHFTTIAGQEPGTEQQIFLAVCSPLITPDVKETLIQNNTMVFKSVHKLDMNFIEVTQNGEFHLGMDNEEINDRSWYSLLHPEDILEAREKHVQLIKSRHEMGCMMTVRMITATNEIIWVNIVMHVRQALMSNSDEPVILCINQVISEQEAYHFKIQGHLFALYAPRAPDFIFGSAFCAPIPPAMDGNMLPQQQASAFLSSAFFKGQSMLESSFQAAQTAQAFSQNPLLTAQQTVCLQNGNQVNGQQGHSNTLKALKRKLQENFTSACKPSKISRLSQDSSPNCGYLNASTPLPSSFETNAYRNSTNSSFGSLSHHEITSGPMQMMYCQDVNTNILQAKNNIVMPEKVTKPATTHILHKAPSMEQVVPEVSIPKSFLTPDQSPVSSPQPATKQEVVDQKVVDPILVAKHLCALKQKQMNTTRVPCVRGEPQDKKPKNLPSLDVSFVDSFFDEIGVLTHSRQDESFQRQSSHSRQDEGHQKQPSLLERLVTVKDEPVDTIASCLRQPLGVTCPQQQDTSVDFDSIDIEDLLGLKQSEPKIKSSDACDRLSDMDDQRLPICENQPSPTSSYHSTEDKLAYDDIMSTFALTPESDFDTDSCEDVLDPESWLLESCSVNRFDVLNTSRQSPDLKLTGPCSGDNELYQLKQLISSWTPSGVRGSTEESQ